MLTNFISDAANIVHPPASRSTEARIADVKQGPAIRINIRSTRREIPSTGIYDRAREIYYRARTSHRLSRAAGIF